MRHFPRTILGMYHNSRELSRRPCLSLRYSRSLPSSSRSYTHHCRCNQSGCYCNYHLSTSPTYTDRYRHSSRRSMDRRFRRCNRYPMSSSRSCIRYRRRNSCRSMGRRWMDSCSCIHHRSSRMNHWYNRCHHNSRNRLGSYCSPRHCCNYYRHSTDTHHSH